LEPRAAARPRPEGFVRLPGGSPGAVIGASSGLVLRFARDEDAGAIIALISAVWSEYPGKTLVAATDMPELLAPASAYAKGGGRFWVVEARQSPEHSPRAEIIGTIALMPSAEPGVIELQKLYVARGVRKNGLGSFLCHLVEREARERGAHAIELWSDVKLLDAHQRYERLGYRRGEALKTYDDTSGTVRYYYRKTLDPEPADHPDRLADAPNGTAAGDRRGLDRWQVLLQQGAGGGTQWGTAKP
jgi:putative acetyltransferase